MGGASLALKRAGYRSLVAVDFSPSKAAVMRAAGFGVHVGDVRNFVEWVPNERPFIVWASPPCQPFSDAGKRLGRFDPRDQWPATICAASILDPVWLMAENVALPEAYTARLLASLRSMFPFVDTRILDAADYGTPQNRKRQIFVAGPERYRWPEPTHGPDRPLPWVGISDVLHLDAPAVRAEGVGAVSRPTSLPAPTITTRGTLYTCDAVGIKRTKTSRIRGRRITPEELLMLQGFPLNYPIQGGIKEQDKQVGDAVPPQLVAALLRELP